MENKKIPVANLKPYEKNPRNNDSAVDAVAESIRQFGFLQPIVIDKNNVIVAGHTRYKAAKKLGITTVPVVLASELTPEQVKKYRILDNKLNELATWNFDLLNAEIADLDFDGFADLGLAFDFNVASGGDGGDDGGLPEELKGQDLTPDKLENITGDDETAYERVIIVYTKEQRGALIDFLGLSTLEKVVYPFSELTRKE